MLLKLHERDINYLLLSVADSVPKLQADMENLCLIYLYFTFPQRINLYKRPVTKFFNLPLISPAYSQVSLSGSR